MTIDDIERRWRDADDIERRWRDAKIGERRDGRVCVWVECEGDPRAEVLGLVLDVNTRNQPRGGEAIAHCMWSAHGAGVRRATKRLDRDGMHLDVCDACAEAIETAMAVEPAEPISVEVLAMREGVEPETMRSALATVESETAAEPAPALVPKPRKARRKAGKS